MSKKSGSEDDLLKEIERLRSRVAELERTKEKAAEQELQLIHAAKMVTLGTLISGVAHEINNPNHYIRLNAEIMERLWKEISPILKTRAEEDENFRLIGMEYEKIMEKVPLILRGMADGTVRIQRIVESLKSFSNKNTGELNQSVNINNVVKNVLEIAAHLIKKSTDNLTLYIAEDLPNIQGNAQQLEQVIINLLTNSCQALSDKKRGITISTFPDKNRNNLILELTDEGEGIPPEVLPHIMDPFYTTKRDESSTGLGLSISYSIIRNHGGVLKITSEGGHGTRARIEIPIRQKMLKGKNNDLPI